MEETREPELIVYVDGSKSEWQEFRPGSRRKVLYEDAATDQLTMLVQWDAGYRMCPSSTMNMTNICTSCQGPSSTNSAPAGRALTF